MANLSHTLSVLQTACLLEAAARKPGNVHPGASFADVDFDDFACSAEAIAPVLANCDNREIGRMVFDAVGATQKAVGTNTNLGIILLAAPLTACGETVTQARLRDVLSATSVDDARWVYRAIRHAAPGGLGTADEHDVADEPTDTLANVMRAAAARDRIAEQYADGYTLIFDHALPELLRRYSTEDWETAVIGLHLFLMAGWPDTLIARKCGPNIAHLSADKAAAVLQLGWPHTPEGRQACDEFDRWLRSDGHRYNPGTTADLVAATLLVALLQQRIIPPSATDLQQHIERIRHQP